MTDYTELVNNLRLTERVCRDRMDGQVMLDAAAAIEELQQIADHYEQTAKDYWQEACEYKAQLPKRGEWKITTEKFTPELICSKCGVHIPCVAGWCMDAHMNYCPNCGAKM